MRDSIELYNFQKDALKLLLHLTKALLISPDKNNLLLKAPTGSGKTIIMGKYIEETLKRKDNIVFVWLCETPNLTLQSKRSIDENFNIITKTFDESSITGELENRSVTFVNWEIIKKNRIGTVTGDTTTSLVDLCQIARSQKKKIYFIIDEAHINANSKQSLEQVEKSNPDVIVDVTATPNKDRKPDYTVEIKVEDVQEVEVIKNSIVINKEQEDYGVFYREKHNLKNFKEFIIHKSLSLRDRMEKDVKEYYKNNEGDSYVPLLLIQLPPHKKNDNSLLIEAEALLKKFGYTRGNNLAVYQSDDYSDTLENIGNNEKYKVLLFKNAIAKGWDCPRASILTMLRKPQTKSFTTQTIGRIMRSPNRKYYPGKYSWLNKGYIYIETDVNEIIEAYKNEVNIKTGLKAQENPIKEELYDKDFSILTEKWDDKQSKIELKKKLSEQLEKINWSALLKKRGGIKKENVFGEYDFKGTDQSISGIQKKEIDKSDEDELLILVEELQRRKIEQNIFENVVRKSLLNKFNEEEVNNIIYSNLDLIENRFETTLADLKKSSESAFKTKYEWQPDNRMERDLTEIDKSVKREKYLYKYLIGKFNNWEKELANILDEREDVIFWIRNVDYGKDGFSVAYNINGKQAHFYPDFIVKTTDRIEILETKKDADEEAISKYEALKNLTFYEKNKKMNLYVGFLKKINGKLSIYDGNNFRNENSQNDKWKPYLSTLKD